MDYGIVDLVYPLDASSGSPYESFEPARNAMGDTLTFARQMDLIAMAPRDDLSSTGYVLANSGEEYLVLQPAKTGEPFTVTLEAVTYAVEWHSVTSRERRRAEQAAVGRDGGVNFTAPFAEAGPAVLHLTRPTTIGQCHAGVVAALRCCTKTSPLMNSETSD